MDKLNEIIKNQMISSFETNVALRFQYISLFRIYYVQNIKYHIMWLFFHSFSFAYPEFPSEEYKIETANFLANIIPKNLTGCGSCQNDYKIFIEKLNIYRVISSKQELSSFFVDLHNFINKKKFEQNQNGLLLQDVLPTAINECHCTGRACWEMSIANKVGHNWRSRCLRTTDDDF